MTLHRRRAELALLRTVLLLAALVTFGPSFAQPGPLHWFADQRALGLLPNAMDVLSNLPFAVLGLAGAWRLWRVPAARLSNMERAMAALFFTGLIVTALGSAWYHLQPDAASLVVDRCAMAVAFAGLLGLAAARVSERASAGLGLCVLLCAPWCAMHAGATGNVLPWAVVQFGGMALIAWLGLSRPAGRALDLRWGWVIAAYALAKVFEMQDDNVYALGQLLSGHSIKHLLAAAAALPVLAALGEGRTAVQNAPGLLPTP